MLNNLKKYNVILASKSPRRKELLSGLNIPFSVITCETDETIPEGLSIDEIPVYLAKLKAEPFIKPDSHYPGFEVAPDKKKKNLIITADTIVWIEGEVLGKPDDYDHAFEMLRKLSGKMHTVVTGVCLSSKHCQISFSSVTNVWFKDLSDKEIEYYLREYHPYDKAGSYGVQEWIGYIAINRIEGSYFNVMGLPIQQLYEELKKF